jgi:hypothetical protein
MYNPELEIIYEAERIGACRESTFRSAQWKRLGRDQSPNVIDRFRMHGRGYWSVRPEPPLEQL